jgi:hypothetical protein
LVRKGKYKFIVWKIEVELKADGFSNFRYEWKS